MDLLRPSGSTAVTGITRLCCHPQFERTLIVAEEGAYVSYLEGCTAPAYDSNQAGRTLGLVNLARR